MGVQKHNKKRFAKSRVEKIRGGNPKPIFLKTNLIAFLGVSR
jgi:hypothetical protein